MLIKNSNTANLPPIIVFVFPINEMHFHIQVSAKRPAEIPAFTCLRLLISSACCFLHELANAVEINYWPIPPHIIVHTHFAILPMWYSFVVEASPSNNVLYLLWFFLGVKPRNNIFMHFLCILNSVVLLSIRSALWTPLCIILFLKLARYFSTSSFPCSKRRVDVHNSCVILSLNSTRHSCCTVVYAEDLSM